MKIKICGMKYPQNIKDVSTFEPDFMGFIFYPASKRFVNGQAISEAIKKLKEEIRTVGVFVNQAISEVKNTCKNYHLDYAQLHGNESLNYILELRRADIKVIKVFHVDQDFDWRLCKRFVKHADYFLFDTASSNYGGSGVHFNWELLKKFKESMPFFLSGGISPDDLSAIKALKLPYLAGIDVNSQFEIVPGIKDLEKIQILKNELADEY